MKALYSLMLMLVLSISAHAITATEALGKAVNALHGGKSVSASFTISAGRDRSSGTITAEGQMFKIASPVRNVWFDGRTQWTHEVADREVSITEPTAAELQQVNPFAVIDNHAKLYKATMLKSTDSSKLSIQLTPKNAKASGGISKAVLTLNAKSYLPEKLVITMSSRSVLTISISSVKFGGALGVAAFRPASAAFKGVEIVDLR